MIRRATWLPLSVLFVALFDCLPSPPPSFAFFRTGVSSAEARPVDDKEPENGESRDDAPEPEGDSRQSIVDIMHERISERVLTTAAWLDSFFGDRRYESELDESHLRLEYYAFFQEGAGATLDADPDMRLVLPQLEEKTNLIIAGRPRRSARIENDQPDRFEDRNERNVTTSLYYRIKETAKQNLTGRAGLKLHNGRPLILLGPRYRLLIPLEHWSFRFIEDASWSNDIGWQATTVFDLERPLPRELFFRASMGILRIEHRSGYDYSIGFAVRHPLSPVRALEYRFVNLLHTRPVHELVDITLAVSYRQRLWREWLSLEVTPQCRFPRSEEFSPVYGVTLQLEAFFGSEWLID